MPERLRAAAAATALLLLAVVTSGCAGRADAGSAAPDAFPVVPVSAEDPVLPAVVTGADGRTATVADVDRVVAVSLSGTLAEIVFSLGLGDRVVGRDAATTFAQARDLPLVTRAHDLSAEGLLALDPSVLLTDASTGPAEALDAVRAAGVPVVVLPEAWDLSSVGPRIAAVAAALGVPDAGRRLVARTDAEIAAARTPGPPLRVAFLYLRGSAGVYLMAGRGSGADAMIEATGAVDVGSEIGLERFRPLTSEGLVRAAPDVLVLMQGGLDSVGGVDGLLQVAGVAQTPAGRDRRVVTVEDGALLSFGPRTGAVVAALAERLAAA